MVYFLLNVLVLQQKDGLVKISRSDFEEVIRSTPKTLSEEEVEYYEKVAKESDNFMFG